METLDLCLNIGFEETVESELDLELYINRFVLGYLHPYLEKEKIEKLVYLEEEIEESEGEYLIIDEEYRETLENKIKISCIQNGSGIPTGVAFVYSKDKILIDNLLTHIKEDKDEIFWFVNSQGYSYKKKLPICKREESKSYYLYDRGDNVKTNILATTSKIRRKLLFNEIKYIKDEFSRYLQEENSKYPIVTFEDGYCLVKFKEPPKGEESLEGIYALTMQKIIDLPRGGIAIFDFYVEKGNKRVN